MSRPPTPNTHPVEQFYPPPSGLRLRPRTQANYRQQCNIVYAETHGIGLVMDCFAPRENPNGLAIVDVVAGAWHSDRIRLNEHIGLGPFDVLCEAGFTVFAVRPGSATLFTAADMVRHVHGAIRCIKGQAREYEIDPARLGLFGASAGGHIAALAALAPEEAHPYSREHARRHDSRIAAAALLFAPTDFTAFDEFSVHEAQGLPIGKLLFDDGTENHDLDEVRAALEGLSPVAQVHPEAPPFLLLHGTADTVVPHKHSLRFAEALEKEGVPVEVILKKGGGHPWPDTRPELQRMVRWYEKQLKG